MPMATTTRMAARESSGSPATSLREMTMISAERIRSVRTAPPTIVSSASLPFSTTGVLVLAPWPEIFDQIFSAPSKHR